jgi:hypothetical protein
LHNPLFSVDFRGIKVAFATRLVIKRIPSRRLGAQAPSRTRRTAQAEHRIDELGILSVTGDRQLYDFPFIASFSLDNRRRCSLKKEP